MTGRCNATLAVAANQAVAWLEHQIAKETQLADAEEMTRLANLLRAGLGSTKEKTDD